MMTILDIIEQRERDYQAEIEFWKAEAKEYEEKYHKLLNDTIHHGEQMIHAIVRAALEGNQTP